MATFGLDELCLRCSAARELKKVIGINISNNILGELQSISTDNAKENFSDCQWFGNDLNNMEWCSTTITWKSSVEIEIQVPLLLHKICVFLSNHLDVEGLFRVSGSWKRIALIKKNLESGSELCDEYPHDVTNIFSQILRQLPTSLIPQCMNEIINDVMENEESKLEAANLFCLMLPTRHLHTLLYTCHFFYKVASHCDKNKMSVGSLATVLAPNIIQLPVAHEKTSEFVAAMTMLADFVGLLIKNCEMIGCVPALLREVTCPPNQCIHRDQWMLMMADVSMVKNDNRRKSFLDRFFQVCNKARSTNISINKDRKRRQYDVADDEAPAKRRSLQGAAEQVAPFPFNGTQPPLIDFVSNESTNVRNACDRHDSGSTACFGAKPRIKQSSKKTPVKPHLGRLGVPYPVTPSEANLTNTSSCVPEKQRKTFLKKLTLSFLSPSVRRSARKKIGSFRAERRIMQDDVTRYNVEKNDTTRDVASEVESPSSSNGLHHAEDSLRTADAASGNLEDTSSNTKCLDLHFKQASSGKTSPRVDMENLKPERCHIFRIDDSITVFDLSDIPGATPIPDAAIVIPDVADSVPDKASPISDIAPVLGISSTILDADAVSTFPPSSSSTNGAHHPIVDYSISSEEADGCDRKISNKSYEDILDAQLESDSFVVTSPNCSFLKKEHLAIKDEVVILANSLPTSNGQLGPASSSPRYGAIVLDSSDEIFNECKSILQKIVQDVASCKNNVISSSIPNPHQGPTFTRGAHCMKPTPPVRSSSKGLMWKGRSIVRETPRANLLEHCIVKMYESAEELPISASGVAVASPTKSISQPSLHQSSLERLRQVKAAEKIKLFEDKKPSSRPCTPLKMPPIRAGKVSANIQLFNHLCEAPGVRRLSPLPCRDEARGSFKLGPPSHLVRNSKPRVPGRATASVRLVKVPTCRSTDAGMNPTRSGKGMPLLKIPLLPVKSVMDDMVIITEGNKPPTTRHRKSKSLDSLINETEEFRCELSKQERKVASTKNREQTPFSLKAHAMKVPGTPPHQQLVLQTFNIDEDYLDNSPIIRATPKFPRSRSPIAPMPSDLS